MRIAVCLAVALASTTAAADSTRARVDAAVAAFRATHAFQGAVVVVVDRSAAQTFAYGAADAAGTPFTASTPIAIADQTATFTGALLAILDRATTVDRKAPLRAVVQLGRSSPVREARLEDLAASRSGLPRELPGVPATKAALYASLDRCGRWRDACVAPRGTPRYSRYGFVVLGNVLADLEGAASWGDLASYLVAEPLGMTHTCGRDDGCFPNFDATRVHGFDVAGREVAPPWHTRLTDPAAGLWSTATDMTTWLRYNLGRISPTSDWRTGMLDAALPDVQGRLGGSALAWERTALDFADGTSSAVRWQVGRASGFVSYVGIADDRDTAVFVFVNRDPSATAPADVLRDELGEPILTAL